MPIAPGADIEFWYEFASTYSYPAAMRLSKEAQHRGVRVRWRPFVLGPIFAEFDWTTSPFNIYEAKGAYMWRDVARTCAGLGFEFQRPAPFPQNSLLAARVALVLEGDLRARFSRALYVSQFAADRDISDPKVVADAISAAGDVPEPILDRAQTQAIKNALRQVVVEAKAHGIFGAPSFVCADGELFWGNDRLEDALDWALSLREE